MGDAYGASVRSTGKITGERPQWAAVERAIFNRLINQPGWHHHPDKPLWVYDGYDPRGSDYLYRLTHHGAGVAENNLCRIVFFKRPTWGWAQPVFSVPLSRAHCTVLGQKVPDISQDTKEKLLRIVGFPEYRKFSGPEGANRMAVRIGACGYSFF